MDKVKEDVEVKITESNKIKEKKFELLLNQKGYAKYTTQVVKGEIKMVYVICQYYTNANIKLYDELGFYLINDNNIESGTDYFSDIRKVYAPLIRACDGTGQYIGQYVPYVSNGKLTFSIEGGVPSSKLNVVIRYADSANG